MPESGQSLTEVHGASFTPDRGPETRMEWAFWEATVMTRAEALDRIEQLVDHIDRHSYKNCAAERRELADLRALIDALDRDAARNAKGRAA
jgi:hypothetical protein